MIAEIYFCEKDAGAGAATLLGSGFDIETYRFTEEGDTTVVVMATIPTQLDASSFLNWVGELIDPHDGFVSQVGRSLAEIRMLATVTSETAWKVKVGRPR